jgi:hypothetical protein
MVLSEAFEAEGEPLISQRDGTGETERSRRLTTGRCNEPTAHSKETSTSHAQGACEVAHLESDMLSHESGKWRDDQNLWRGDTEKRSGNVRSTSPAGCENASNQLKRMLATDIRVPIRRPISSSIALLGAATQADWSETRPPEKKPKSGTTA